MCNTHILHSETRPELEVLLEAQPGFPAHSGLAQRLFLSISCSHSSGQQRQAAGEAPGPGQEEEAGGRRLEALGPRPTELCCVCRQHDQKLTNLPINSYNA